MNRETARVLSSVRAACIHDVLFVHCACVLMHAGNLQPVVELHLNDNDMHALSQARPTMLCILLVYYI